MKWHYAGPLLEQSTVLKSIVVGGKKLCLIKYKDQYFALAAKCPHAGADLSGGWCEDGKLVCPFHRYSFDIKTGQGSAGQNDYIDTYPVEVKDDGIYVGVKSFWDIFDN